jgi:hypothetical protein
MFKSTENKGFHMTFENGWTISVQFGYGNYCDNRHHNDRFELGKNNDIVSSATAEIGIWNADGKWYTFDNGDEVKGYCSPDEVAKFITIAASL